VSEHTSIAENLYQEDLYQIPPGVLIILSKDWSELREEDKALLTKILGSVRLNLAVVRIITRESFTAEDLAPLNAARVIAFGATCKTVSGTYQNLLMDGTPFIAADALEVLDDVRKKNLWLALKQMFAI
jgi:hypothetical protein